MRSLFLLLIVAFGSTCPQSLPDSLTSKVVIFKSGRDLELGSGMRWGYPRATGFYLDTGSVKHAFVVTARHVLRMPDTVGGLHVRIVQASGRVQDKYLGDYRVSQSVITHPDFLVDIALLRNSYSSGPNDSLFGFTLHDILPREEFSRMDRGDQVFYIGMHLDSIGSERNVYTFPRGTWLSTFAPENLLVDSIRQIAWRADFSLKIPGALGVSGSPVLAREGSGYRLVGIVNGFGVDASGKMVDTAYCTAAYRILEALQDTTENRWRTQKS